MEKGPKERGAWGESGQRRRGESPSLPAGGETPGTAGEPELGWGVERPD